MNDTKTILYFGNMDVIHPMPNTSGVRAYKLMENITMHIFHRSSPNGIELDASKDFLSQVLSIMRDKGIIRAEALLNGKKYKKGNPIKQGDVIEVYQECITDPTISHIRGNLQVMENMRQKSLNNEIIPSTRLMDISEIPSDKFDRYNLLYFLDKYKDIFIKDKLFKSIYRHLYKKVYPKESEILDIN